MTTGIRPMSTIQINQESSSGAVFGTTDDIYGYPTISSNTDAGCLSVWVYLDSSLATGTYTVLSHVGTFLDTVNLTVSTGGVVTLLLSEDSATPDDRTLTSTTGIISDDDEWHHIMASWDTSTDTYHLYIDGVESLDSSTGDSSFNVSMDNEWDLGHFSSAVSKIAEFWIDNSNYIDLSVKANRRKFITASKRPAFLGWRGEKSNGSNPTLYMRGEGDDFKLEYGSDTWTFSQTGYLGQADAPLAGLTSVVFDGTGYLRNNALIGTVAGDEGTVSVWVKYDGLDSETDDRVIFSGSSGANICQVWRDAVTSKVHLSSNGISARSSSSLLNTDSWVHILISWDNVANTIDFYVNDSSDVTNILTLSDGTSSTYIQNIGINSSLDTDTIWKGEMSQLWVDENYLDLSVTANRRKFIDASGNPVDVGSRGKTPTAALPLTCHFRERGDFGLNRAGTHFEGDTLASSSDSPSKP